MQELNKLIMEDLHDKNDNNLTLINAKKEFEFIYNMIIYQMNF